MNTGVLPTATHRYQTNPRRMCSKREKASLPYFYPHCYRDGGTYSPLFVWAIGVFVSPYKRNE